MNERDANWIIISYWISSCNYLPEDPIMFRSSKCRIRGHRVKSVLGIQKIIAIGENNNFGLAREDQGHLEVSSFDHRRWFLREKGQFLPALLEHMPTHLTLGLCKYNFQVGRIRSRSSFVRLFFLSC